MAEGGRVCGAPSRGAWVLGPGPGSGCAWVGRCSRVIVVAVRYVVAGGYACGGSSAALSGGADCARAPRVVGRHRPRWGPSRGAVRGG